MAASGDFQVADISLADFGRRELEMAEVCGAQVQQAAALCGCGAWGIARSLDTAAPVILTRAARAGSVCVALACHTRAYCPGISSIY